jgi:hypothetical protein
MDEITESPGYEPERQPPAPQQPELSAVQRLWMAFTSPGEVFADIRVKPTWILCLAVMVVLGVVVQFVVMPHLDIEASIRARLARSPSDASPTR